MTKIKLEELAEIIMEDNIFAYSNYIAPYKVLKSFFLDNSSSLNFDKFYLNEITYKELVVILTSRTGKRVLDKEWPDELDNIYKWEAWLGFLKYKIPYTEGLDFILKENEALKNLNESYNSNNDEEIQQRHLEYIEIAQEHLNFINYYRKP
ncbi:hypothetical protein AAEU29_12600 [Pseudoalteromonas sp. SSM20]|uniref:hypothetical protein n=1 Tax=Pseudoalteromonas sp. SSM20 TaxID=3139394 RepID=UPI003BA96B66